MIYLIIPVLIIIVLYFLSSKSSPIPYYPTHKEDLEKIIASFEMKNDMAIADLGAGDGTVIFTAAQKAHKAHLNTAFFAVDINPLLVVYMKIQRLFHPHKKHIHIMFGDMFKLDYRTLLKKYNDTVFYLYISPWFTAATAQMIRKFRPKATIISYFYPVEGVREDKKIKGIRDIYIYRSWAK